MDDAVARDHISGHDVGTVHGNAGSRANDINLSALQGSRLRARANISGHDFAGHDVIQKHRLQLLLVFRLQKVFNRAFRQLVEGRNYNPLFVTVSGADLYGFPSPDSDFDLLRYGVITARRGGLARERCINSWTPKRLRRWLERDRG